MRDTRICVCAVILLALAFCFVGALSRRTSAQDPPQVKTHFAQVGKVYQLTGDLAGLSIKILQTPRGSWVKVDIIDKDQPRKDVWVNLDRFLIAEEK
jgi:hypothetical protein